MTSVSAAPAAPIPAASLVADKAAACRVLEEIFPANDVAALPEVLDDDFVNHEAPPGAPAGLGSVVRFMSLLASAFSDQRWVVHSVVAEGDLVAIRCTHRGRHTGDYFGVPASGRDFAYQQMHLIRMRNGRGVEHWAVRDDATLMRQLTGTGPPERPTR